MSRPDPATARAVLDYHALSKHRPGRYAPGPGGLDWANQPNPFRTFAGAPRLELPHLNRELPADFDAVRRGSAGAPRPFDLEGVAALFELSFGLSAWKVAGANRWALRCNPSSGNLHPTEAYLVCGALPGLGAGVYHYVSLDHAFECRAGGEGEWPAPGPGVFVGLSGVHWREAWKYGERAFRYCQHDAGHAIAALGYAAAALGWQAHLVAHCGDARLAALLGLDREGDFVGAEREAPEALLWVGEAGAEPPSGLPAPARTGWAGRANRLSDAHRAWPALAAVAVATGKPDEPPYPTVSRLPRPPLATRPGSPPASRLIRQRRSAVDFDGVTALPREAFFAALDALLPRAGVPPWDALPWEARAHAALFVHRVTGLEPGLYFLARGGAADAHRAALRPEWLWAEVPGCPAHLPLRLLLPFDLRAQARGLACHQAIAADSAFSLAVLAEFEPLLAAAPWRYRQLFWEAGALGHVLYLEAEGLGVRGTGIGCYFDDEVHGLLGLAGEGLQDLYHFTVGGPVDDPRLRTEPAYPPRRAPVFPPGDAKKSEKS